MRKCTIYNTIFLYSNKQQVYVVKYPVWDVKHTESTAAKELNKGLLGYMSDSIDQMMGLL